MRSSWTGKFHKPNRLTWYVKSHGKHCQIRNNTILSSYNICIGMHCSKNCVKSTEIWVFPDNNVISHHFKMCHKNKQLALQTPLSHSSYSASVFQYINLLWNPLAVFPKCHHCILSFSKPCYSVTLTFWWQGHLPLPSRLFDLWQLDFVHLLPTQECNYVL